MSDNKPGRDVTKDWQASQSQKSSAGWLRIGAAISWIIAIGGEIWGIVMLFRNKFSEGNLSLLVGMLIGIAVFAIIGNFLSVSYTHLTLPTNREV